MKVPGYPIAYWASENFIKAFITGKQLGTIASPRQGLATGDNDRFLRLWYEVATSNIFFSATDSIQAMYTGKRWFPCTKGGAFRKWYGNNEYIVNWQNNGKEIINFVDDKGKQRSRPQNRQYYFMEGGTWSTLSSADFSMRYCPKGFIFETKGSMCFANEEEYLRYIIGFLNTSIVKELLLVLSPTLDYHEGPLSRVPVIVDDSIKETIDIIVEENIKETKRDWDSFETSWDFKKHPLI